MSYYNEEHGDYFDDDDATQLFKKPESFAALNESNCHIQGNISPYRFVDFEYPEL